jgi:hypothetical protein
MGSDEGGTNGEEKQRTKQGPKRYLEEQSNEAIWLASCISTAFHASQPAAGANSDQKGPRIEGLGK